MEFRLPEPAEDGKVKGSRLDEETFNKIRLLSETSSVGMEEKTEFCKLAVSDLKLLVEPAKNEAFDVDFILTVLTNLEKPDKGHLGDVCVALVGRTDETSSVLKVCGRKKVRDAIRKKEEDSEQQFEYVRGRAVLVSHFNTLMRGAWEDRIRVYELTEKLSDHQWDKIDPKLWLPKMLLTLFV